MNIQELEEQARIKDMKEGEEITIIHHADCFDGVAAAWVTWTYYRMKDVNVNIIPAYYGTPAPDIEGKRVYIVDFSYPREEMLAFKKRNPLTLVLDHHKTAEENLRGLDFAIFDMKRSGCGIAWDHFFQGPRPWWINAIEDRDLWRFFYTGTQEIIAYVSTLPYNVEAYDRLKVLNREAIMEKGEAILRYIDKYGAEMCKHFFYQMIGETLFPVMNIPYLNCSEHLDLLIKHSGEDRAASFYFRGKDKVWQFSLRSRGDFDVSAIAKLYGGGGHKNAAGFEVKYLPWEMEMVGGKE